ncbi:hypothetical protein UK23_29400 [Lentzea aerocolonigenes]|uniref:Uncharacterized protein n=1 Tax=Lentzea aerocolonigenes TaxID=68170 RepID=A0A0F0GSQ3_LENAE|nr:hypothetical protein UK23_29400 [Lentzea aerocolonigenes]
MLFQKGFQRNGFGKVRRSNSMSRRRTTRPSSALARTGSRSSTCSSTSRACTTLSWSTQWQQLHSAGIG